jgi:uncharacterized protein YdeI (YjbR/CyaY-like superfamily)
MPEEKLIEISKSGDFIKWLSKNHDREKKVGLIVHKKHTGKNFLTHYELMLEAICYGWIDTTAKRLDKDKFIRFFVKRNKNSNWSYNTISYAKKLIKEKRMMPPGMEAYKKSLTKKPLDYDLPANPTMPDELKVALDKNKKAKENFEKFSYSVKKMNFRWILRAKRSETKKKRIDITVKRALQNKKPENSLQ